MEGSLRLLPQRLRQMLDSVEQMINFTMHQLRDRRDKDNKPEDVPSD